MGDNRRYTKIRMCKKWDDKEECCVKNYTGPPKADSANPTTREEDGKTCLQVESYRDSGMRGLSYILH